MRVAVQYPTQIKIAIEIFALITLSSITSQILCITYPPNPRLNLGG